MALDSSLLYYFVKDALIEYSENFRIIDRKNPNIFDLNGSRYSSHVSYVHDSGNARVNEDEARIQIGRGLIEVQRKRQADGYRVAFLGFFEDGETFVAWDPRHVFSLEAKTVVSVYARQSQADGVQKKGAAVHEFKAALLKETSFAIALPASALGIYLENIEHFHRLPSEAAIVKVITDHSEATSETGLGTSGNFEVIDGEKREKFSFERLAYPRDPKFKRWVLDAYDQTCCICGRQLGIIQAAHIIPHSEADSPNTVQNGLALCVEHHRLYDDGLLLPGPGQALFVNPRRAEYLRQVEQEKGLESIESLSGKKYNVPDNKELRPKDEYLERGLSLRVEG